MSAAYVGARLTRGWIPHDEGTIAHSAERVLLGELPHRDYGELYTGGLTFAHALAFRLLGVDLVAPRLLLFALFLAWVPALYSVVARFVRPVPAAALTLLAVAWSVPAYPVSLPSWYNLFFATFGTAALARYVDTRRRRWLVAAGACGGLSILCKIVGLYFVAGGLLFLVYRAQVEARAAGGDAGARTSGGRPYALFVVAALTAFVAALVALTRRGLALTPAVHYVVPGAALALALAWNEWRIRGGEGPGEGRRFARLLGEALPFVAGAALPVALFFGWYATRGALPALLEGVFVLPQKRLTFASYALPPLATSALAMAPLLAALVVAPRLRGRLAWAAGAATLLAGAAAVAMSDNRPRAYLAVWHAVRTLPPVLAVAGAALLLWRERGAPPARREPADARDPVRRQDAALVLCVMATCTLVQYPFAGPIYFCYVAPLVVAAVAAVDSLRPRRVHPAVGGALVAVFLAFAVVRIHPGYLYAMPSRFERVTMETPLDGPRGGLLVTREEAADVRRLLALLASHAPAGGYVYASPDCPEVYFLSGLRNPTGTLFDFFDEPAGRDARVLRAIDAHDVRVVAVNTQAQFSGPMSPALADSLGRRFPNAETVGRFIIRWR